MCHMRNFIFHSKRVQGAWHRIGSKSRCSYISVEEVLLFDGKKRKRLKLGALFKKIGKWALKVIKIILALGAISDFVSLILSLLG